MEHNQNQVNSVSNLTSQPLVSQNSISPQGITNLPNFAKTLPPPESPKTLVNNDKSTPVKDSSFVRFNIPVIDFGDDDKKHKIE